MMVFDFQGRGQALLYLGLYSTKNTHIHNLPCHFQGLVCAGCVTSCSVFATPQTVACQAPLSMGILQARILGGLPFPPPGNLPSPGTKYTSLRSPALAGGFLLVPPGKP